VPCVGEGGGQTDGGWMGDAQLVNTTVAQMCPDFCCNTPAECNALGNFRLAAGPTPWEGRLTLNGTQNYLPRP
jgi:hypothetical protein